MMSPDSHIDNRVDSKASSLDVFFRISDTWDLSTDQQIKLLGSPARSTYFRWRKGAADLSPDTLERISHLGAIFKALAILNETPQLGDAWLKRPNRFFDGATALEVMLTGNLSDMVRVRQYLDAQRGG
jgi:uncharacterized protein (DUF2384 family)